MRQVSSHTVDSLAFLCSMKCLLSNVTMHSFSKILLIVFTLITTLILVQAESRIAIMAAFPGEMESIRKVFETEVIDEVRVINGTEFGLGKVHGMPAVFFITQVSMTNAAMHTQLLLSNFDIEAIFFAGIAGGINPDLKKGDVTIPLDWVHHMQGSMYNPSSEEAGEYIVPGWRAAPDQPNFGSFFPGRVSMVKKDTEGLERKYKIPVAQTLIDLSVSALEGSELINATGAPATLRIGGGGGAGPVFMDNREYREYLWETWEADVLDMESSAIAHVAYSNGVPCLIVRSISDLAGGQEGQNEIFEFAELAQDNAARVLDAILKSYAASRD